MPSKPRTTHPPLSPDDATQQNHKGAPPSPSESDNRSLTIGSPSDGQSTPSQPFRQAKSPATTTLTHDTRTAQVKLNLYYHQRSCHCCQSMRGSEKQCRSKEEWLIFPFFCLPWIPILSQLLRLMPLQPRRRRNGGRRQDLGSVSPWPTA